MRKAIFQICALLVVTLTIPAIAAAGQMVPGVSDKEVVVVEKCRVDCIEIS